MQEIPVHADKVKELLQGPNPTNSSWLDGCHPSMQTFNLYQFINYLINFYNWIKMPRQWKEATVTCTLKKGDKSNLNQFQAVYIKLKKVVHEVIMNHFNSHKLNHVMRKPVHAICEQQRRRSACASAQSDQRLCCSLPRQYNNSSFYIRNFKPLPSFCGCAGWFESYLVKTPKTGFL